MYPHPAPSKIPYFKRSSSKYIGQFIEDLDAFVKSHPELMGVLDVRKFDGIRKSYKTVSEDWESRGLKYRVCNYKSHRAQLNAYAGDLDSMLATFKGYLTAAPVPYRVQIPSSSAITSEKTPPVAVMRQLRSFAAEAPVAASLENLQDDEPQVESETPPPYMNNHQAAELAQCLLEFSSNRIMPPPYGGLEHELNAGHSSAAVINEMHNRAVATAQPASSPSGLESVPHRVAKGGLARRVLLDLLE